MMLDNSQIARQILSTTNAGKVMARRKSVTTSSAEPGKFQTMLQDKMQVKFSKHAQKRLSSRNIELSSGDMDKINRAVQTARTKGAKDSLVLLNNLAFVVSVKNNMVITAVDNASAKENIFTNIDSAVIAN